MQLLITSNTAPNSPGASSAFVNNVIARRQDYFRDVSRDDVRELLPAHADALADPAFLIPPLGRSLALLGDDAAAGATCMTQKRLIAMRRGTLQSAAAAAETVRTSFLSRIHTA